MSDFAAETAKLSLWIAKYQMDRAHRDMFGSAPPALPLSDSGNIVCDNALRVDWQGVCPQATITRNRQKMFDLATVVDVHGTETVPDEEAETYIVGNPPYLGKGKKETDHLADMERVFNGRAEQWGYIDYVGAWFVLAGDYIRRNNARAAMVATNSIAQGRQLPQLWPVVLEGNLNILFAHTSFKWTNNAAMNAGVTCVVIGLGRANDEPKTLFDKNHAKHVKSISPYLTDGPTIYVESRSRPIVSQSPRMITGSVPNDGGHLILDPNERAELLLTDPQSERLIRRFGGSKDIIQGIERYCLFISDNDLSLALSIPKISKRLNSVRIERLASKKREAREILSNIPHRFQHTATQGERHAIVVPQVCSENRSYFPVDYLPADFIVSNLAFVIPDGPLWAVAILTSRMHMVWLATVCGKLETRYRYSNTLGWHTFPIPKLSGSDRDRLEASAERILIARAESGGTLAELYEPEKMPPVLADAHRENDGIVDAIYSNRVFRSDAERLGHLFRRYARILATGAEEESAAEFDFDAEEQAA